MGRVLFIVSRNEPRLHAYLKEQFTGLPSVDVVIDRRRDGFATDAPPTDAPPTDAPPTDAPPNEPERRRRAVDGDLRRFGWAVVKRGEPGP